MDLSASVAYLRFAQVSYSDLIVSFVIVCYFYSSMIDGIIIITMVPLQNLSPIYLAVLLLINQ